MKLAPATAVLAAIIGVSAVASPVLAQDYGSYQSQAGYACQATKHQDETTGGILGALAGAVIGSNLAAHGGGRTGGALLGAAAGAAVGSNIGVASSRDSGACQAANQDDRYGQARYDRDGQDRDAQYRDAQYHDAQYSDDDGE